ncbi:putative phage tail protein [Rhizobium sp. BK181]|uniref:putative phage tail protein n=1 Tax=Rhizobium sp. BK181 TaxID=2587072 RepID=UPI0017AF25AB|nr:putative phage tail protein [Rhizobium sp. BK181]
MTSSLAKFTRVLLDGFVWLYARAFRLALEASVDGVDELLPDWEAEYGLPENCFIGDQTTVQRLRELARKVRADSVNHPEQFVRLALDHGFEIEIEEPSIFECGFSELGGFHTSGRASEEVYWIVRVKDVGVSYFEAGVGECGYDPLFSFGAAEQILCLLRKLAPAWTLPVLAPWITLAALVTEDGKYITDGYGNRLLVTL